MALEGDTGIWNIAGCTIWSARVNKLTNFPGQGTSPRHVVPEASHVQFDRSINVATDNSKTPDFWNAGSYAAQI